MKAGWESWQGGFIRVGFPPCQPPLVAAESSSPSFTPKSGFQIVDILVSKMPSSQLPGPVHLPPKWSVPRVASVHRARRFCFLSTGAGFHILHRSAHVFTNGGQSVIVEIPKGLSSIRSLTSGVRLYVFRRSHSAVSVRGRSVSSSASRRLLPWFGFRPMVSSRSFSTKPFVATEVVPKNCYCYSSRLIAQ